MKGNIVGQPAARCSTTPSRGENDAPKDLHRPRWTDRAYKNVRNPRVRTADAPRDALVFGKFAGTGNLRELRDLYCLPQGFMA
jgi:hypothetical protein